MNLKRITLSIISILALGGLVFGATQAFFSDTETSSGNRFQAGKIDLKIDHAFASYNGEDCETCEVTGPNLVVNGSFEEPVVDTTQFWDAFPHNLVPGWSAEWVNVVGGSQPATANIELHRGVSNPPWLAQDGNQYTELDSDWDGPSGSINNEQALIRLFQEIPTVNGKKYELTYWHSYRPGRNASENEMFVYWNGAEINHVAGADGTGETQTSWVKYTHEVVGNGNPITLMFTGAGPNNSFGIFLDNVSLREKTCGFENGQCTLWEEKDLKEGDIFWNFDDVKPGDFGRNVVSMHVYDNNAWACILPEVTDLENTRLQVETDAGDTSEVEGELSQFMNLFVWREVGTPNGVYEPTDETPVYGSGAFGPHISIAEPDEDPLTASTTYYYGMAWCFGEQTVNHGTGIVTCDGAGNQNIAQTDVMEVILNFHAEQSRNNPDFSCANLVPAP